MNSESIFTSEESETLKRLTEHIPNFNINNFDSLKEFLKLYTTNEKELIKTKKENQIKNIMINKLTNDTQRLRKDRKKYKDIITEKDKQIDELKTETESYIKRISKLKTKNKDLINIISSSKNDNNDTSSLDSSEYESSISSSNDNETEFINSTDTEIITNNISRLSKRIKKI